MPNPVEQLHNEYEAIAEYLIAANQISMLNDLNKNFRKIILLSASSYFEHAITKILTEFVRVKSDNDQRIVNFLEKQAISQKYHTLFDWGKQGVLQEYEKKGANKFWKLFGDNFKTQIELELKPQKGETEEQLRNKEYINQAIEAFIEIGHHRNILVHSNFADYDYDQKTSKEIYDLFKKGEHFLTFLKEKLI